MAAPGFDYARHSRHAGRDFLHRGKTGAANARGKITNTNGRRRARSLTGRCSFRRPCRTIQNFFTAPILKKIKNDKIAMTPYGKDGGPDFPSYNERGKIGYIGGNGRATITDLKAWQNYYRNPTNFHAVDGFVMTNGVMIEQTNYLNHATGRISQYIATANTGKRCFVRIEQI